MKQVSRGIFIVGYYFLSNSFNEAKRGKTKKAFFLFFAYFCAHFCRCYGIAKLFKNFQERYKVVFITVNKHVKNRKFRRNSVCNHSVIWPSMQRQNIAYIQNCPIGIWRIMLAVVQKTLYMRPLYIWLPLSASNFHFKRYGIPYTQRCVSLYWPNLQLPCNEWKICWVTTCNKAIAACTA